MKSRRILTTLGFITVQICALNFYANAQNNWVKDIQGIPITATKTEDVKGSPLMSTDWQKATVKLKNGVTYKDNMYVMYNLEKDELYFKGEKGEVLAFVDPVSEFILLDNNGDSHYFKSGYSNVPGTTTNTFLEVIGDGSVKLLKHTKSYILESKDYSSPGVKTYNKDVKYYLLSGANVQPVKPDKKSIITALGTKQNEVEKYLKENNLNFKKDTDLTKLITYYNSI
ncbi:hypothetical protein ABDD95_10060 [Mucilaginibacter sp. PAMB04274]|uniref:hypothetical protein n=1 Tax=Mucilaginibacter sp. PAMB04274 TaxID=3138568 RepID=UPI0031F6BEFE